MFYKLVYFFAKARAKKTNQACPENMLRAHLVLHFGSEICDKNVFSWIVGCVKDLKNCQICCEISWYKWNIIYLSLFFWNYIICNITWFHIRTQERAFKSFWRQCMAIYICRHRYIITACSQLVETVIWKRIQNLSICNSCKSKWSCNSKLDQLVHLTKYWLINKFII